MMNSEDTDDTAQDAWCSHHAPEPRHEKPSERGFVLNNVLFMSKFFLVNHST